MNRLFMETIVTVYVVSLLVSSAALMYALLRAEKPKSPSMTGSKRVDQSSKSKRLTFLQKIRR